MKNIWRAIRVILEIAIACIIFFLIATKTPLFERAIPWQNSDKENWSITTWTQYNNTIPEITIQTISWSISKPAEHNGIMKVYESNGNIVYVYDPTTSWYLVSNTWSDKTYLLDQKIYPSMQVIEVPVQQKSSCVAPRWEIIKDKNTVIAYKNLTANKDNVCLSEARTCNNWTLNGSYQYTHCNYILNGTLIQSDGTKIDITPWSSNNIQQLVSLDEYIKKRDSIPERYIQPVIIRDNTTPTLSQVKWQPMNNSNIPVRPVNRIDKLDQTTVRDSVSYNNYNTCNTPRWDRIEHGTFVYAYNIRQSSYSQQCISQKRACIDGKLSGSFQYKSCTVVEDPIGKITNTSGDIFYTNPKRPPITYSSQNYINPWNSNIITWSNNTYTNNNIQKTCTTPRWTTISHTSSIVTYRLPTSTDNSLCDREVRVCRNGVLHGSYTYQTCMEIPNNTRNRRRDWWNNLWN